MFKFALYYVGRMAGEVYVYMIDACVMSRFYVDNHNPKVYRSYHSTYDS